MNQMTPRQAINTLKRLKPDQPIAFTFATRDTVVDIAADRDIDLTTEQVDEILHEIHMDQEVTEDNLLYTVREKKK